MVVGGVLSPQPHAIRARWHLGMARAEAHEPTQRRGARHRGQGSGLLMRLLLRGALRGQRGVGLLLQLGQARFERRQALGRGEKPPLVQVRVHGLCGRG